MQQLYDAIMTLGRSASDARNGGWVCEEIGTAHSPKCVNGLITWHLGWICPQYITQMFVEPKVQAAETAAALLAGRALLRTIPEGARELAEERGWLLDDPDTKTDKGVEDDLVEINDLNIGTGEYDENGDEYMEPFLNYEQAAEWFERALDLLAKDLPDPIPATPLIVDTILDFEGAPERVLVS